MQDTITATLTVAQLLALPGEAVLDLILTAQAPKDFIQAAYDAEGNGKARWIVRNRLSELLKKA